MCWHNYTQHSGCGHYGEVHAERYTLCHPAYTTIMTKRGPSSPAIAPPQDSFFPQQPKRSNTTLSRRFFGLGRSNTAALTISHSSRRKTSGPESVGVKTGTKTQFPDHEKLPVVEACPDLKTRTIVSSNGGQVCKECAKWVEAMRNMILGYDKGRGLRGNAAFAEFLEGRRECSVIAEDLGFGESRRGVARVDSGDALYEMRPLG